MKSNLKKGILVVATVIAFNTVEAQNEKVKTETKTSKNITMRWDKNTPEQEMNDDIKALKEAGVEIKYSNLKRNKDGEITSLRVEYKDESGNSGSQEYNGSSAIAPIFITKNGNTVGFGQNSLENGLAFQDFDFDFDRNKENFILEPNALEKKEGKNHTSKIIIKKDGKGPLIIKDGEVVRGANEYSEEEINTIKKGDKLNLNDEGDFLFNFDSRNLNDLRDQIRIQIEKMGDDRSEFNWKGNENKENDADYKKAKKEMEKARRELEESREELEKAREEMQKAKSEMKIRKA